MSTEICEECTGCGACSCICPKQCITMKENRIAEVIPFIDSKNCIHCDLCKKLCPQNSQLTKQFPQNCYVAWSKNKNDLVNSASGGVAAVIARYQLEKHMKIYGCDYTDSLDLVHFCLKNENDIIKMESSKYSQSNAFLVFKNIKNDLIGKYVVVFIGTPCQVAGLRRYLRRDFDNLITVDLVCHGTPPNKYLKEYIQKKHISYPIDAIRFRGEFNQQLTVWKNNNIIYQKPYTEDLYFSAFYDNKISRNACYTCQYAESKRIADITLADFWGLGKLVKIKKQSNRPSLVLVNTEKGKAYFHNITDLLFFEERPVDEAIRGNGRLNNPPGKNREAILFQKLYPFLSFTMSVRLSKKINNYYNRLK